MKTYILNYQNYLKICGLAPRTIAIYTSIVVKYLKLNPDPEIVEKSQIIQFIVNRGAARTMKQSLAALNHFYKGVLNSDVILTIPKPKDTYYVPNILSEIEMCIVIDTIKNLKHEAIIQLIYSCALRVSEAINLKVTDISKTKNVIKIVNGKGGKTAYVPIPEETKNLLREYYLKYKPTNYLFQGQKTEKYSASSIRKVLNKAVKAAKIKKHIRVHDLRHSRATHLLENGVDIKFIKKLLRHKKIETTERYLHLTTNSLEKAITKADNTIKQQLKYNSQPVLLKISA